MKYRIDLINEQGCYFDGARDLTLGQCRTFATGRGGDYRAEVRVLDNYGLADHVWYYRNGRKVKSS